MVKFIFRWGFRLLLLGVVLAGVLILCKDALIKAWLQEKIRTQTGMDVKIRRLEVALFSPTVSVEGFTLYHPARFGGLPLLQVPDLYLEYDRAALWYREVHLRLARLEIAELNWIEDPGAPDVIQWLQALSAQKPEAARHSSDFPTIDVLNLSLGTLKLTRWGNPAKSRSVQVGLRNELIEDVRSVDDLAGLVLKILWQSRRELDIPEEGLKGVPVPSAKSPQPRPARSATNNPRR